MSRALPLVHLLSSTAPEEAPGSESREVRHVTRGARPLQDPGRGNPRHGDSPAGSSTSRLILAIPRQTPSPSSRDARCSKRAL
jgi:hypothetical protein